MLDICYTRKFLKPDFAFSPCSSAFLSILYGTPNYVYIDLYRKISNLKLYENDKTNLTNGYLSYGILYQQCTKYFYRAG